jgi:hypothetical protein
MKSITPDDRANAVIPDNKKRIDPEALPGATGYQGPLYSSERTAGYEVPDAVESFAVERSQRVHGAGHLEVHGILQGGHGAIFSHRELHKTHQCRYCGNMIVRERECESKIDPKRFLCPQTGKMRRCRCNPCEEERVGYLGRKPPAHCGRDDCRKEYQRQKRAAERERANQRAVESALELLEEWPEATPKEIAEELGIRPKWAKVALDNLAESCRPILA